MPVRRAPTSSDRSRRATAAEVRRRRPRRSPSAGKFPAGPSCANRSPAQSRRRMPAWSSIDSIVGIGTPQARHRCGPERPNPRWKRPPVRACIVEPHEASTIGCRVPKCVMLVPSWTRSVEAATCPRTAPASFVGPFNSESQIEPRPRASAATDWPVAASGSFALPGSVYAPGARPIGDPRASDPPRQERDS